jgi:hypothetical protein
VTKGHLKSSQTGFFFLTAQLYLLAGEFLTTEQESMLPDSEMGFCFPLSASSFR